MCGLEDVNLDGFYYLVCHFQENPEYWEPGENEATLTGEPLDGTAIEGTDSICVVPSVENQFCAMASHFL